LAQVRAPRTSLGAPGATAAWAARTTTAGETDERLFVLAAWRDAPYFTDAERAALALTEAVTRLSDRADPVPDEIWEEAARHYDEPALAALIITIATINVWNRLNVTTRQVAGSVPRWEG
jgi:alkylhydroperoxidase family enzyme